MSSDTVPPSVAIGAIDMVTMLKAARNDQSGNAFTWATTDPDAAEITDERALMALLCLVHTVVHSPDALAPYRRTA